MVETPRRKARGRARILYWFRTPPGVRVGRAPLDEDAIRLIEDHHPGIRFDWQQILNGEEEAPAPLPPPRPARDQARADRAPGDAEVSGVREFDPLSPAHAQLGSEGLARLRARYADVMAAISRRIPDAQRQEQLRAEAARLNPDNWVTADEVRLGVEEYEAVFESLRTVLMAGRRGRRRRRSGAEPPSQSFANGTPRTPLPNEETLKSEGDSVAATGERPDSGEASQD